MSLKDCFEDEKDKCISADAHMLMDEKIHKKTELNDIGEEESGSCHSDTDEILSDPPFVSNRKNKIIFIDYKKFYNVLKKLKDLKTFKFEDNPHKIDEVNGDNDVK
jgi:hypothetical protein